MKPSDFKEHVYKLGIPIRVTEIEAELRAYQRDHPDLFLSETPIQLLRPELKNGASSNGSGPKKSHAPGGYSLAVMRKRENSAALLAWIGAAKNRTLRDLEKRGTEMRGLHQLIHYGYLRRQGDRFVRTAKEYVTTKSQAAAREPRHVVAPTKTTHRTPQKRWYSGAALKQREASAALIASFDTETPSAPPPESRGAMGVLTRRGYLRRRGKGLYVRTHKAYLVQGH